MISREITRFGRDDSLFGVLHVPDNDTTRGIAICPPFGEEAKSAYRALYEFADLAAEQGMLALRFDYFGTGNSAGGFEEFTPDRACADIAEAVALLHDRGAAQVTLLGLGMGGTLACKYAAEHEVDSLVLWQPIVSGAEFHKLNIKRQLIRQMLTHGKAKGAATSGDLIDLDGYPLRKSTAEQIKQLDLLERTNLRANRVLLMQISHSQSLASDLQKFADGCTPAPDTACTTSEPFWLRIGFVDCGTVYNGTFEWLKL